MTLIELLTISEKIVFCIIIDVYNKTVELYYTNYSLYFQEKKRECVEPEYCKLFRAEWCYITKF